MIETPITDAPAEPVEAPQAAPAQAELQAAASSAKPADSAKRRSPAVAKKASGRKPQPIVATLKKPWPIANPVATSVAKPEVKPTPKSVPKPTAKAAPDGKAKAAAKPAKRAAKQVSREPKVKLVRERFTMPERDFALIAKLKGRALEFKRPTKKSELLRAGLQTLAGLDGTALRSALESLAPLKPKQGG